MTHTTRNSLLALTIAATFMVAQPATAQFSFGGGGIKLGRGGISFGGGSSKSSPITDMRYRGPNNGQIGDHLFRGDNDNIPERPPITDMRYRGPKNDAGRIAGMFLGNGGGIGINPRNVVGTPKWGGGRTQPHPCPTPGPAPIVDPIPAPIVEPPPAPIAPKPITDADRALALTLEAQEAFTDQDYRTASKLMDQALKLQPESSAAYQFRSLTHFAQGDYDKAAADVYEGLLRGPLWTWDQVHPMYENHNTYTNQYRFLVRLAREDDESMSKHFLLAYHHLVLGHLDHGETELRKVLAIQPEEPVTTQLLNVVVQRQGSDKVAMK